MMKKIISLALLFCFVICSTAMADLVDPFNVAHDYLTSGVAGTGWSGIMNVGNATIFNASTTAADKLRMTGVGDWGGTGAGGPFLYKEVTGDFIAETGRSLAASGRESNFVALNRFQLAGWSKDDDGVLDPKRVACIRIGWGGYYGAEGEMVQFSTACPQLGVITGNHK